MVPEAGLEPARACHPRDFKSLVSTCSTTPAFLNTRTAELSRTIFFLSQLEATPGFEPGMEILQTSALPLGYVALKIWSGKRGSNPRLQPWQGCALPLSYSRSSMFENHSLNSPLFVNKNLQICVSEVSII